MKLKNSLKPLCCAIAVSTCLVSSLAAQVDPETDPEAITWIPKIANPPVIDGEIDDIWHADRALAIARLQSGVVEDEVDFSADWYGLWDDTYYYFLFDVTDQVLESEAGADIWRNDRIEVYFNMDNVKPGGNGHSGDNYQYGFHWNKPNEQFVSNSTWTGIEWAQTTTDYGYIIEVKIPWTTLTTQFTAEVDWSFGYDIAINDNDGMALYDSVTYWWNSNGQSEWGNIDGAGTVGLGALFNGNYPPTIESLELQTADEGTLTNISLTADDLNTSDTLTFDVEGLPSFAQLNDNNDGTATIAVNAQAGDANIYEMTATVSDGEKSASTSFVLIVKDPNVASQLPVIDSIENVSVRQGNLATVDVMVTDIDSLTVSITGDETNPDWVTVIDNGDKTGTVRLNPSFEVPAQGYTVTVLATDPDENEVEESFSVTVIEQAQRTTYYCDPVNGNITNDGSPENPWSSLEEVFTEGKLFTAGDTIYLLDGYHGEPSINAANTGYVYIRPDAGASPELARLVFGGSARYWDVSGLQISRSFAPTFSKATMVSMGGQHLKVADCDIFSESDSSNWDQDDWLSIPSSGVGIGGSNNLLADCSILNVALGVSVTGTFNTVRGNHIQNFTVDGMRGLANDLTFEYNYVADNYNIDDNHDDGFQAYTNGSGGVGSGVIARMVLRGNTIIETTDTNRAFQGSLQGIGCFDGMFEDWIVENNVIIVNQWHGIALYGAINCKLLNNTVVDQDMNRGPGPTWITLEPHKNYSGETDPELKAYYLGSGNLVRNNLTTSLANKPALGTYDNNKVIGASDFANYFVSYPFDLRLKAGSPAIDAGTNAEAPTNDALGNPRIADGDGNQTAVADWGAFEFSSWRGYGLRGGWSFTGAKYLGWLYVVHGDWVFSAGVGEWVFAPEAYFSTSGTWVYFSSYEATTTGWYFSNELNTWVYGSGNHWGYVLNTGS